MNKFLEQFTIIDFLGMFIPGAACLMFWINMIDDIRPYFEKVFGDNTIIFLFGFVFLSYFIGTIFHEMGSFLLKNKVNTSYLPSNPWLKKAVIDKIKAADSTMFADELEWDNENAWKHVYQFVLIKCTMEGLLAKTKLFQGFFVLCRTTCIAIIVVCLIFIYRCVLEDGITWFLLVPVNICYVLECIFYRRYERFAKAFANNIYYQYSCLT